MKLFLFLILHTVLSLDYYQLLGVTRNADEKTIKKAFKKLSLEEHPDRNSDQADDQGKFMKISQAYEVLMNPAKREVYDRFGEEGITVGALRYPVDDVYNCYYGFKNPQMFYQTQWLYENSQVLEIKDNNLKSLHRRNEIWVLQFYGPRCHLAHQMVGEWNALASRLEGIAKVAAVNCEENDDVCKEYNVRKYPSLLFFPESTIIDHEPYTGPRDSNTMYDFVLSKISGFLRFVNKNNLDEFISSDVEQIKLISFTNQKESVPLVKVLSREFKGKAVFGEIRSTDQEMASKFQVRQYPGLVLVTPQSHEVYTGQFSRREIEKWIDLKLSSHKVLVLAKELNKGMYNIGNCNINDSKFCFICFDPNSQVKETLNQLAEHFNNDPVSVFWVNSERYPFVNESFEAKAVIVRGKKIRHSVVECPGEDYECFKNAIDDALSGSRNFVRTRLELDFTDKKGDL